MARRKYGEGSVFQRKDGRWIASIRLENGKKKLIYCKSEKERIRDLKKGTPRKRTRGVVDWPTANTQDVPGAVGRASSQAINHPHEYV